jgi:hypothetical protein
MRSAKIALSVVLLVFNFSCVKRVPEPQPSPSPSISPSPIPANQVGDFKISDQDVEVIKAIQKVYDETRVDAARAFASLKADLTIAQILRNNGFSFDHEALIGEAKYYEGLDTNKKFNDRIHALFAPKGKLNKDLYLRDVILPEYAVRLIYHVFFLRDPKIQREAHQRAIDFFEKVKKTPDNFDKIAQDSGFKSGVFRATERLVSPEYGPFEMASPTGGKQLEGTFPFLATAETSDEAYQLRALKTLMEKGRELPPGQIVPEVIEVKEGWWVYRVMDKSRKPHFTMKLRGVYFPKADYAAWLAREKAKVNGS